MVKYPILSVVVTVYNEKPEYIQRAILSLNNQSFKDFEVLIVDDGSSNSETLKCLKNIKQDNIKILHKKNGGLGSARNYGITQAKGELIGFLDADDWVDADFYAKLVEDINKYNADVSCGVLVSNGSNIDNFPCFVTSDPQKKLKYITNGSVCSKVFKRNLFNDIKFPEDGVYFEDNPVVLKLLLKAKNVSFNPSAKYTYFVNEESITRNKDTAKERKRIDDSIIILSEIKKWAEKLDKNTAKQVMTTIGKILFMYDVFKKDAVYQQKIKEIYGEENIDSLIYGPYSFIQRIFSIKKSKDKKHKIITVLGIKFYIKKKSKKNIYDIIYSIGYNCACASNLNRFHLRKTSGPFDWLYKASFEQRYEILINDFANFLNKDDLEKMEKNSDAIKEDEYCDYYRNKANNLIFLHDFPVGKSLDVSFDEVKQKYNRRIKRFIENVSSKKQVLLVWYALGMKTNPETILMLHQQYCKKLNKNVDLLFIENDETMNNANNLEYYKLAENIFVYKGYFWHEGEHEFGNYELCKRVFSDFKLKNHWPFLKKIYSKRQTIRHKIITVLGIKMKFKKEV